MRALLVLGCALVPVVTHANPRHLSLDDALALAAAHGYDNLLADAARLAAEGDLLAARALPNPQITAGWAHEFNYVANPSSFLGACIQCAADGATVAIADQGAIEGTLSGKRALRRQIAELALRATKMERADVRRNVAFLVKQRYVSTLAARKQVRFASEVAQFSSEILSLARSRYPKVIDEGQLARVESDKLQSDADLRTAEATAVQEESELRYLIGIERDAPRIELDDDALAFRIPSALANTSEPRLLALALAQRPDLAETVVQLERAARATALARKELFPDITLSLNYYAVGLAQNAVQPPQLTLTAMFALPLFSQHQGEIRRAQAEQRTQLLQRDKTAARLVADVRNALATFLSMRDVVGILETAQLAAARKARDITKVQWEAGSVLLADYLDAERTYVAVNRAHLNKLAAYWTAVYQLELAIGGDLRR